VSCGKERPRSRRRSASRRYPCRFHEPNEAVSTQREHPHPSPLALVDTDRLSAEGLVADANVAEDAPPIEKLAECDRHLVTIGTEVATLQEELARLREEAEGRDQLLVEREAVIAELSDLLPMLDAERARARRHAESATVALKRADAILSEQAARVLTLEQEMEGARARTVERDRAHEELGTRLAEANAKVEEYARALADAEARARAAEPAQQQLEALTAEREHLLATMRDEREHARLQAEEASASLGSAEARLAKESTRAAALERELMSFGSALAERVGRLAELEAELAEGGTRVDRERSVPIHVRTGHVCFVLVAGGYKLIDVDTAPARPGELVELEGKRFVAARIGRSPIPGDTRPCVYLLEDPDSDGDFHLPDPNELDPSDPSVMAAPDRSTRFEGSSHGEQGAQG